MYTNTRTKNQSRIWKFPLKVTDEQEVELPSQHRILSVGVQDDEQICLWAMVDPDSLKKTKINIVMYRNRTPHS